MQFRNKTQKRTIKYEGKNKTQVKMQNAKTRPLKRKTWNAIKLKRNENRMQLNQNANSKSKLDFQNAKWWHKSASWTGRQVAQQIWRQSKFNTCPQKDLNPVHEDLNTHAFEGKPGNHQQSLQALLIPLLIFRLVLCNHVQNKTHKKHNLKTRNVKTHTLETKTQSKQNV